MTGKPKNLSQAIDELENEKPAGWSDRLQDELKQVEETLAKLRPHLEELSGKVTAEASKAKGKVENEMQKNPWATIGIVAFVAFLLGFLFSHSRRKD